MKLINKKSGKIIERYTIETARAIGANLILQDDDTNRHYYYNSLAELNEEWKDYEEPETFWYISPTGTPIKSTTSIYDPLEIHLMKRIGNYFESEEDAEKAVEKCVALTRLENKGFKFYDWVWDYTPIQTLKITASIAFHDGIEEDLDLLFNDDDDDDMPTNAEINDLTDMGYGG